MLSVRHTLYKIRRTTSSTSSAYERHSGPAIPPPSRLSWMHQRAHSGATRRRCSSKFMPARISESFDENGTVFPRERWIIFLYRVVAEAKIKAGTHSEHLPGVVRRRAAPPRSSFETAPCFCLRRGFIRGVLLGAFPSFPHDHLLRLFEQFLTCRFSSTHTSSFSRYVKLSWLSMHFAEPLPVDPGSLQHP